MCPNTHVQDQHVTEKTLKLHSTQTLHFTPAAAILVKTSVRSQNKFCLQQHHGNKMNYNEEL
jgi:hypothetical protein